MSKCNPTEWCSNFWTGQREFSTLPILISCISIQSSKRIEYNGNQLFNRSLSKWRRTLCWYSLLETLPEIIKNDSVFNLFYIFHVLQKFLIQIFCHTPNDISNQRKRQRRISIMRTHCPLRFFCLHSNTRAAVCFYKSHASSFYSNRTILSK